MILKILTAGCACHLQSLSNQCVRKLYRKLRGEQMNQRQLDKATFSGMFERGAVVADDANKCEDADEKAREHQKRLQREVYFRFDMVTYRYLAHIFVD